jgi:hypothetical protein
VFLYEHPVATFAKSECKMTTTATIKPDQRCASQYKILNNFVNPLNFCLSRSLSLSLTRLYTVVIPHRLDFSSPPSSSRCASPKLALIRYLNNWVYSNEGKEAKKSTLMSWMKNNQASAWNSSGFMRFHFGLYVTFGRKKRRGAEDVRTVFIYCYTYNVFISELVVVLLIVSSDDFKHIELRTKQRILFPSLY